MAAARRFQYGYTFLEIALAMGIVLAVFLAMVPLVQASIEERQLRACVTEITEFVLQNRSEAARSGRKISLQVEPGGLRSPGAEPDTFALGFPANIRVELPASDGKWRAPEGQNWQFSSVGTVTPMRLRLNRGDKWIELDFDFLTGRVAEERYAL